MGTDVEYQMVGEMKVIVMLYMYRLSTKRVRMASPGIIILKLLFMLSIVRLLELESAGQKET